MMLRLFGNVFVIVSVLCFGNKICLDIRWYCWAMIWLISVVMSLLLSCLMTVNAMMLVMIVVVFGNDFW